MTFVQKLFRVTRRLIQRNIYWHSFPQNLLCLQIISKITNLSADRVPVLAFFCLYKKVIQGYYTNIRCARLSLILYLSRGLIAVLQAWYSCVPSLSSKIQLVLVYTQAPKCLRCTISFNMCWVISPSLTFIVILEDQRTETSLDSLRDRSTVSTKKVAPGACTIKHFMAVIVAMFGTSTLVINICGQGWSLHRTII